MSGVVHKLHKSTRIVITSSIYGCALPVAVAVAVADAGAGCGVWFGLWCWVVVGLCVR
jgi:hypothetical protein